MSIWNKILTALRGAATETGESIVDNQALRILDQEMRDAKNELHRAKESLTTVMAEKMGVERKVNDLRKSVAEHEEYATKALDKGDEALALEIANKIAEFTNELVAYEEQLKNYNENISTLKRTIGETERNIQTMQREVSVVKTTEAVQKANDAAAARFSGSDSSMRKATESLERIKQRQQTRSDKNKAAMELEQSSSGSDLKTRMKAAGIIDGDASGNAVLAKLREKRAVV